MPTARNAAGLGRADPLGTREPQRGPSGGQRRRERVGGRSRRIRTWLGIADQTSRHTACKATRRSSATGQFSSRATGRRRRWFALVRSKPLGHAWFMEAIVGRDVELEAIERWLDRGPEDVLLLEGDTASGRALADGDPRPPRRRVRDRRRRSARAAAKRARGRAAPPGSTRRPPGAERDRSRRARNGPRLGSAGPTLVAIDDVQWVDRESGVALAYMLRRLGSHGVRVLLARRSETHGPALGLEQLRERVHLVRLEGLSVGAVARILHERTGRTYARTTLRRLHEVSAGNPFFALELGRALENPARPLAPDAPLPVPQTLTELVRARVEALPLPTLEVLALASAQSRPELSTIAAAVEADPLPVLKPALAGHLVDSRGGPPRRDPLVAPGPGRARPRRARRGRRGDVG